MTDYLSAGTLAGYVRTLAEGIGPRPAGSLDEAAARAYVRGILEAEGITDIEEQPFPTPNTWGYGLIIPALMALGGDLVGRLGRRTKTLGAGASLTAAAALWRLASAYRGWFQSWQPRQTSANLIARLAPTGPARQCVVLIGHTDTNKHRLTFAPQTKHLLQATMTAGIATALLNGLVQLAEALGWQKSRLLHRLSLLGVVSGLGVALVDEMGDYVDGANDNATAVACLLGLGQDLVAGPLHQTEVWLAFTGAEEPGCVGMHALLDRYGDELADAWFIDFEMVGTPRVCYVTHHSGLAYGSGYAPDPESLALADRIAAQQPALEVAGRPLIIAEEVGTLRRRGYRGICLAGVGPDGWLANWHRTSDCYRHIDPVGLERAARFARAMLDMLDSGGSPRSNGRG